MNLSALSRRSVVVVSAFRRAHPRTISQTKNAILDIGALESMPRKMTRSAIKTATSGVILNLPYFMVFRMSVLEVPLHLSSGRRIVSRVSLSLSAKSMSSW
jgi:hypothetical protein